MFNKKLTDLIEEKEISVSKLSENLNTAKSVVCSWKNGTSIPKLDKALILKEYFNCSLDYLFGDAEYEIASGKLVSNFSIQLKKILKSKKITQQKMFEELKLSTGNAKWHKLNSNLRMDTVVKIANYLQVSIDYLVGIE